MKSFFAGILWGLVIGALIISSYDEVVYRKKLASLTKSHADQIYELKQGHEKELRYTINGFASLIKPITPVNTNVLFELKWDAVEDAAHYRVYIGDVVDGISYLKSATNTETEISSLVPGLTYTFRVTAVNKSGVESLFSDPIKFAVPLSPVSAPVK